MPKGESRKILKNELCNDCRQIYYQPDCTIEYVLDSTAYNRQVTDQPVRNYLMNISLLSELKKKGGCEKCIGLLEQVTQ